MIDDHSVPGAAGIQRRRVGKRVNGIETVAWLYAAVKVDDFKQAGEAQYTELQHEMMDFWPQAASSIEPLRQSDFIAATYRDVWTPRPFEGRLVS
ncbi:MAG: hypothetical protein AAGA68_07170 [Pseudomonadota bacterium]